MIVIDENAHIQDGGDGYELFTLEKKIKKDGTTSYEPVGGHYYSTLSGCLNGYIEYLLKKKAAEEKIHDIKEIVSFIEMKKNEITQNFNPNLS